MKHNSYIHISTNRTTNIHTESGRTILTNSSVCLIDILCSICQNRNKCEKTESNSIPLWVGKDGGDTTTEIQTSSLRKSSGITE